jgi:hypothetical protein
MLPHSLSAYTPALCNTTLSGMFGVLPKASRVPVLGLAGTLQYLGIQPDPVADSLAHPLPQHSGHAPRRSLGGHTPRLQDLAAAAPSAHAWPPGQGVQGSSSRTSQHKVDGHLARAPALTTARCCLGHLRRVTNTCMHAFVLRAAAACRCCRCCGTHSPLGGARGLGGRTRMRLSPLR